MKLQLPKASTSVILTVVIQDSSSSTGAWLGSLDESSSIVGGYVRMGGTGVALAVDENVTTEGTYEAPTSAGQVRIGTPANMTTGTYELHFHNDLWAAGADAVTITLGGASNMAPLAIEVQLGPVAANVTQIGGVAQSATDLKDFADTGYDPATHKVAGVVLADECTANADMVGTDGAALASVCKEGRLAELDAANLPADLDTANVSLVKIQAAVYDDRTGNLLAGTLVLSNGVTLTIDANGSRTAS